MEINEIDGNNRHIYRLKKVGEIQEMLTTERQKRSELCKKNITGVNIYSRY